MKKLYCLVGNGGDGSYSINYTMNEDYIKEQQRRYDCDESDYEYDLGIDGDGFHYDVLLVPDECTCGSDDARGDGASVPRSVGGGRERS